VDRPLVNQWISIDGGSVQADLLWPRQKLIVEMDGHRFHGNRHAFEHDRDRDQRLVLAGYRVVRFTWRQITRESAKVGRRIIELLDNPPSLPRSNEADRARMSG